MCVCVDSFLGSHIAASNIWYMKKTRKMRSLIVVWEVESESGNKSMIKIILNDNFND